MTGTAAPLEFDLALSPEEAVAALTGLGFHQTGRATSFDETWYDTFDWRLYRLNSLLCRTSGRGGRRLSWLALADGAVKAQARISRPPRWAQALPAPLKEALAAQIGPRALLPLLARKGRNWGFALFNEDQKTVLRAEVTVCSARRLWPEAEETTPMAPRIRLFPIKGYDAECQDMAARIIHAISARPLPEPGRALLMRALGLQPGGYSSKCEIVLRPDMTAFEAARHILQDLWRTAEANEAGVRNDIDIEFLHDFRVSLRRIRSAAVHLHEVFPGSVTSHFRTEFSWLAAATGPTRDLDVHLGNMDGYGHLLPMAFREDLAPLRPLIVRRRRAEYRKLLAALASARFLRLKQDWQELLANEAPQVRGPNADRPARDLASERIWRLYRRLIRGGRAVTPQSPAPELHELRKTAKKLRYMLEFFKSLYPSEDMGSILKVMKLLQEDLGNFQDYEVQSEALEDMARVLSRAGDTSHRVFLAMGMLMALLADFKARSRLDFDASFKEFNSASIRHLFRKLFKDGGTEEEA